MGHRDAAEDVGAEGGPFRGVLGLAGLGRGRPRSTGGEDAGQPLSAGPRSADLAAALLPVRRGLCSLFVAGRPADDAMFVLSSPASSAMLAIHGYGDPRRLGEGPSRPEAPRQADLGGEAREGVHDLLATLGIGWTAISPADLETGALERARQGS